MFETLFSTVVDIDDAGLRQLTHDRLKVFAKFTAENCTICKALGPRFGAMADDASYAGILFVRLESDENPVAKQLMSERAAPFFVSYCQGRLLECNTCTTEADMEAQLDRLRHFVPQKA